MNRLAACGQPGRSSAAHSPVRDPDCMTGAGGEPHGG
jgi:hypothetical protein